MENLVGMRSDENENENWIRCNLIPKLVQSGSFSLTTNENPSKTDIVIKSCDIKQLSAKDAFMLTICYKVRLILEFAPESQEEAYGLVVKITPKVEADLYETFNFETLFKNEINAYEKLFPALGWSDKFPKYYYSHNKKGQAAIALGDFTLNGWTMSKELVNLPLKHILVAVQELGHFHGEFYALKHTDLQTFLSLKENFEESRFRCDRTSYDWDTLLKIGPKRAVRSVRNNDSTKQLVPERFLNKLEKILADPFNYQRRLVQPKEPMAILCHGDYLRNNIAFSFGPQSGFQKDSYLKAMIFDFQTVRYASPMVDLASFIANSTGVEVRSKHFELIFKTYCDAVRQSYCVKAKLEQDNIPGYLSYESFLKEYALYMPYGLSIAASFIPCLHAPSEFDLAAPPRTLDELLTDGYQKGGSNVDKELRALVVDMYHLYHELNIDLVE